MFDISDCHSWECGGRNEPAFPVIPMRLVALLLLVAAAPSRALAPIKEKVNHERALLAKPDALNKTPMLNKSASAAAACPATCNQVTCDYWGQDILVTKRTCAVLEAEWSCDCSGCNCLLDTEKEKDVHSDHARLDDKLEALDQKLDATLAALGGSLSHVGGRAGHPHARDRGKGKAEVPGRAPQPQEREQAVRTGTLEKS